MIYLDSCAAIKLVITETESSALLAWISERGRPLVSSALLRVELRRALQRIGATDRRARHRANTILDGMALMTLNDSVLDRAGELDGQHLRSLDAIHLATALLLDVDPLELVTYDTRLAAAARTHGLTVHAPTPEN